MIPAPGRSQNTDIGSWQHKYAANAAKRIFVFKNKTTQEERAENPA
jgi:hypothetical protein